MTTFIKKHFFKYVTVVLLLAAGLTMDFQTKQWARCNLKNRPPASLIPGMLDVGFLENRGMVFGILNHDNGHKTFISIITWLRVAVLIGVSIVIVSHRKRLFLFLLPFIFIWMGALGNLIDSFRLGYVIDFIHIHAGSALDWPFYFNLADAYVCVGVGALLLYSAFQRKMKRELIA